MDYNIICCPISVNEEVQVILLTTSLPIYIYIYIDKSCFFFCLYVCVIILAKLMRGFL